MKIRAIYKVTLMRIILLIFFVLLTGCNATEALFWQNDKVKKNEITAVGYALINKQDAKDKKERVLMAIEASKMAAYKELAEQIYGKQIKTTRKLLNGSIIDEGYSVNTEGLIKGARVIKSYPSDGYYITELAIDMSTLSVLFRHSTSSELNDVIDYF